MYKCHLLYIVVNAQHYGCLIAGVERSPRPDCSSLIAQASSPQPIA
ncbi:MAG: hypothetical protein F6K30_18865 [Cyanothece sp. SIO2G6]|nr:hypothetical protein [Cyanothece sp. SIO2G6]